MLKIGKNINVEAHDELTDFLQRSIDVFVWTRSDMVEIDPTIIYHVLNIDRDAYPVRQKRITLDQKSYNALTRRS